MLGYLPPYPRSQAQKQKEKQRNDTKMIENNFYQRSLDVLLRPFLELTRNSNGTNMFVYGKGIVTLHFDLLFIICDTKGADKLTGHYSASCALISRMVRDCNVPSSEGDDP